MNKHVIEAEFIILNSTSRDDGDDTNFLAFLASINVIGSPTTTLDVKRFLLKMMRMSEIISSILRMALDGAC